MTSLNKAYGLQEFVLSKVFLYEKYDNIKCSVHIHSVAVLRLILIFSLLSITNSNVYFKGNPNLIYYNFQKNLIRLLSSYC